MLYKVRPKKKIPVRLFFVLMLYIKFQVPSSSGSLVLQPTKGVTDRRAQTNMPPQLLRSWGGGGNNESTNNEESYNFDMTLDGY